MSVVLEFKQIKKKKESIVASIKSCNLFEIDQELAEKGNGCYVRNTDLFESLLKDRDTWRGEVYNIPPIWNYLFYVLAMDMENNVGYRMESGRIIFLAFDPKPIHFVVSQAIKDVPEAGAELNELEQLLEEAVEKDFLINVSWG